MKKLLITLLLVVFMAPCAFAGDVTDQTREIWDQKVQREKFFEGRASMENLTNVLLEELARFNEIKQSGVFDTIPPELKQTILRWESAYKDVKALLMADPEIVELYQWRPTD